MFMDELFSNSANSSRRNSANHEDDDNLYDIIGCDPKSNTEQIIAEYRIKARELHPDKCQQPEEKSCTERKFCKLQRAKEILADPEKRRDYDRWRQSGLTLTYRKWCSMSSTGLHCSMHWSNANRNQQKALSNVPNVDDNNNNNNNRNSNGTNRNQTHNPSSYQPDFRWNSSRSDSILEQFRNYRI